MTINLKRWKNGKQSTNVDPMRKKTTIRKKRRNGNHCYCLDIRLSYREIPCGFFVTNVFSVKKTTVPARTCQNNESAPFVKVVLRDNEGAQEKPFAKQLNVNYKYPVWGLCDSVTDTACGTARAAAGLFYCPADEKIYLAWNFFRDLKHKPGEKTSVGDDRLQKRAGRQVVSDAFTHGTSGQKVRWLTKNLRSGDIRQGNTFQLPYEKFKRK